MNRQKEDGNHIHIVYTIQTITCAQKSYSKNEKFSTAKCKCKFNINTYISQRHYHFYYVNIYILLHMSYSELNYTANSTRFSEEKQENNKKNAHTHKLSEEC